MCAALKEAGEQTQAVFLLQQLAENGVHENRYYIYIYIYVIMYRLLVQKVKNSPILKTITHLSVVQVFSSKLDCF